MPSRYSDFQLNSGEYVPQYAGSPLDTVTKTNEALQERHYRNLADLSSLQLLREQYQSKVVPGAKDYIQNQFQDIDETLQDIAKNGGENSTAKIAALRNKFLGDQGVLGALQRSGEIQKEVEQENQLIAQGKQPIRKKGLREQAMNTPVVDPQTGKISDIYTKPYQSTVSPYENPVPYMKDIWSELHPDSIEGELKGIDSKTMRDLMAKTTGPEGVDIPLFFESLTKAGIDKNKINSNLQNAFDSYKETPAYRQAIEYADNPSTEAARQKKVFYEHGLLKVFNNISRQYMANPIADDLLRRGKGAPESQLGYNPDLAITSPAPKTPLDHIDNITSTGDINKPELDKRLESFWKNTFGGEPMTISYRNALAMKLNQAKQAGNKTEVGTIQQELDRVEKARKELDQPDEQLTKEAIPYYKAAALYAGATDMNDDQLKAWAGTEEGKKMLNEYKENVLTEKYKSPIIKNIDPEKARDAHAQFLNSTLSQRKVIPFSDPTKVIHMSDIALDKADDEALNISKWSVNDPSKIRFVGETTPQNWLGEGTDVEGEFTNAKVIEVPEGDGKSGKMKRYYISNLPSETAPIEVTEKALANLGKKIPGIPNKGRTGVEVYQPINRNGLVALATQYNNEAIKNMKSAVVVKYEGHTIIAPDYKTAAEELEKLGVVITTSK